MQSKPSLSIIVPAYMEAENIRGTISNVIAAIATSGIADYEILIIDCKNKKGEDDGTPQIAEELAKANPHIRAIHNPYVSLSFKYWQGVSLAKYEHVTWAPGDNVIMLESLETIFQSAGKAEIISCYIANPEVRPLSRRIVSKIFTFFVNILFSLRLRYFNSITIIKTDLLRSLPNSTKANDGYTYNAEILIRLIKTGHKYLEIPHIIKRDPVKIKSSGIKNFWLRYTPLAAIKKLLKLFWEIQIKGQIK